VHGILRHQAFHHGEDRFIQGNVDDLACAAAAADVVQSHERADYAVERREGIADAYARANADAIDIQVTVESIAAADEISESLLSAGYPRINDIISDEPKPDARSTVEAYDHSIDSVLWHKRIHASADPGRPTCVHVRVEGWPNQQFALLFVDWLTAESAARAEYLAVKQEAARAASADDDISVYVEAKEPWFSGAYRRAWEWADAVGWQP